ncbi:extracellular ligand-binding receptor, partial [Striga asiatica]
MFSAASQTLKNNTQITTAISGDPEEEDFSTKVGLVCLQISALTSFEGTASSGVVATNQGEVILKQSNYWTWTANDTEDILKAVRWALNIAADQEWPRVHLSNKVRVPLLQEERYGDESVRGYICRYPLRRSVENKIATRSDARKIVR